MTAGRRGHNHHHRCTVSPCTLTLRCRGARRCLRAAIRGWSSLGRARPSIRSRGFRGAGPGSGAGRSWDRVSICGFAVRVVSPRLVCSHLVVSDVRSHDVMPDARRRVPVYQVTSVPSTLSTRRRPRRRHRHVVSSHLDGTSSELGAQAPTTLQARCVLASWLSAWTGSAQGRRRLDSARRLPGNTAVDVHCPPSAKDGGGHHGNLRDRDWTQRALR